MAIEHLLAIPVYNEARYVRGVLAEVRKYSRNILVIDDGSTDGTADILKELERRPARRGAGFLKVITHPTNMGYGRSLADTFGFAALARDLLGHEYEWLITMDCDEQHEPARIPQFLEAARRDQTDIISGTRYPEGFDSSNQAPWDRRQINRRITEMVNQRLGLRLTDAFCGFKAYRIAALKHLAITEPGYAMPMQFWVQAARAELRIEELPVGLIYNDPTRHFGGILDDPAVRLNHYIEVFEAEMASEVPGSKFTVQRRTSASL